MSELERLRKQIYEAGVAERLLSNDDFKEYQKMMDAEVSHLVNKLVSPSTHPKEYLPIRSQINAVRNLRQRLERLVEQKGKLLDRQAELEAIEEATQDA